MSMNNSLNLSETARETLQQNRTAPNLIADVLRENIFSGMLRAGQPLRQEEIAAQLGVSRMPIREALRQLETEGLITMYPHRGAVVAELSAEELEELTDIRIALETLALRLAIPRVTERDLQRAEEILATAEADADVAAHWSQYNWQFHSTLYLPAERPRLLALIKTLHNSFARYLSMQVFTLHYTEQGQQEHRAFLEAFRRRDALAAVGLLEQHVANVKHLLLPFLQHPSEEDMPMPTDVDMKASILPGESKGMAATVVRSESGEYSHFSTSITREGGDPRMTKKSSHSTEVGGERMEHMRGIFAALVTPFTEQGERVDEAALRQLVDHIVANGVHGLVATGSTGECAAMTQEERRAVLEIVLDQARGRVPVLADTAAVATREVVALSRHAQQVGATGLMVLGPYYEPLNEEELYTHFATVAAAVDLPLMVYNNPAATGYSLRPEFIARLVQSIDNITVIKDTMGDIGRIHYLMQLCADKAQVFNGADTLAFAAFAAGTKGAVWGAANAAPRQCVDLFEALVTNHDLIRGREIWRTFYPLNRFFEQEGYNAAVKAATNMQGINVGVPRLPLLPLAAEKEAELRKLLEEAMGIRRTTASG